MTNADKDCLTPLLACKTSAQFWTAFLPMAGTTTMVETFQIDDVPKSFKALLRSLRNP